MNFTIIAAVTRNYGLGFKDRLPWSKCPVDMQWFSEKTLNSTVIMGRKTFDSLNREPLKNRNNIVISRTIDIVAPTKKRKHDQLEPDLYFCNSFEMALIIAKTINQKTFVIGGSEIYRKAIENSGCSEILLTHIDVNLPVTHYFPIIKGDNYQIDRIEKTDITQVFCHISQVRNVKYEIIRYTPVKSIQPNYLQDNPNLSYLGETGYLQCIRDIIKFGVERSDRTGVGTRALFGTSFRYNLSMNNSDKMNIRLPLFTTKRTFWRGVVAELLWFLSGSTDVKNLQDQGVYIWNGNSSREYLDSIGLDWMEEHTIGASYSFQFRHSGADYQGLHTDYRGSGFDQVAYVIKQLRENPAGRRAIINLWNPSDLDKMAIPPCLYSYQFWVDNNKNLYCLITQRSGDIGLGVPFNVASASLLTLIIGSLTGYKPKELIHNIADTHIYSSHIEALSKQVERTVRPSPILSLVYRNQKTVEDFIKEDFIIQGYYSDSPIKMEMAV